jgi:hypothetical protein
MSAVPCGLPENAIASAMAVDTREVLLQFIESEALFPSLRSVPRDADKEGWLPE